MKLVDPEIFCISFPHYGDFILEIEYEEPLSAITTLLLEAAKVRATVEQIRFLSSSSHI
jgi:hypothetical protein